MLSSSAADIFNIPKVLRVPTWILLLLFYLFASRVHLDTRSNFEERKAAHKAEKFLFSVLTRSLAVVKITTTLLIISL